MAIFTLVYIKNCMHEFKTWISSKPTRASKTISWQESKSLHLCECVAGDESRRNWGCTVQRKPNSKIKNVKFCQFRSRRRTERISLGDGIRKDMVRLFCTELRLIGCCLCTKIINSIVFREAIRETEDGLIQPAVNEIVHRAKRKRLLTRKNLRLGMVWIAFLDHV